MINFTLSCLKQNLVGIWLKKHRTDVDDFTERRTLSCLQVCLGTECNGIVFRRSSHELFVQHDGEKLHSSTQNQTMNRKVHNSKDNTVIRLNRIGETLMELKNFLISQQGEYVTPIQRKVVSLKKILDMFQLLREGRYYSSKVASVVKIKQSTENHLASVVLSADKKYKKPEISILTNMLKEIDLKLKNQIALKHQISKRSFNGTFSWKLQSLRVNKIYLRDETKQNFIFKSFNKRNSINHFNGMLRIENLTVNRFRKDHKIDSKRKRSVLPGQYRQMIVVKSINNFNWEKLVTRIYRKRGNTLINGLLTPHLHLINK